MILSIFISYLIGSAQLPCHVLEHKGSGVLKTQMTCQHIPVIADADREKLEQCDSKYARYLCKIMGVYFDYHKDAYFIKGLYILV